MPKTPKARSIPKRGPHKPPTPTPKPLPTAGSRLIRLPAGVLSVPAIRRRFHSPISPLLTFSQITTWPATASATVECRSVSYFILTPSVPLADSRKTIVSNQSGGDIDESGRTAAQLKKVALLRFRILERALRQLGPRWISFETCS